MLIPQPQYDELDVGFLGRIRILNRHESEHQTVRALLHWLEGSPLPERPERRHLLASATGLALAEFSIQHTLAPFHFAFTNRATTHLDCASQYSEMRYERGRPVVSNSFCVSCARTDLDSLGYSYWRRSHHIPGVIHCPQHDEPLSVANQLRPYLDMPHNFAERGVFNPASQFRGYDERQILKRYISICTELLNKQSPSVVHDTKEMLRTWLEKVGLYVGKRGAEQKPTLADVANEILPTSWLRQCFSGGYPRSGSHYAGLLNRTYIQRRDASAEHYALAMALISSPLAVATAKRLVYTRSFNHVSSKVAAAASNNMASICDTSSPEGLVMR